MLPSPPAAAAEPPPSSLVSLPRRPCRPQHPPFPLPLPPPFLRPLPPPAKIAWPAWPALDPFFHFCLLLAHVPEVKGRSIGDGAGLRDVKTIYTPDELGPRNLRSTFLPVPLVVTAHVPLYLPEMFGGEPLVGGTDYHFSHLLSSCNLDVVHMKDHHRHNVTSNHQSIYTGIYQSLLETALHKG